MYSVLKKTRIIGLMSGTSLDGIDIALCEFLFDGRRYEYQILHAETFLIESGIKEEIESVFGGTAVQLACLHSKLGHKFGATVKSFCAKYNCTADYVASHGQTIFHKPEEGFTCQIGDGAALASECGIPVICDFRSTDVASGGQGAPLVPVGDELLFSEYDYCLNLGGFANISYNKNGKRIAFDICAANMVLNSLANLTGSDFDDEGRIAASGKVDDPLLTHLNSLDYYSQSAPKSLGREWVESNISPLMQAKISSNDLLHTYTEHIAIQIAKFTTPGKILLITGGGAFNKFLIQRIAYFSKAEIVIPDEVTIKFKEALIFAFLGYLRINNIPNCLSSVTGATKNCTGGAVYLP
jgi:anhydro-N-acetylmuramic acid kinase